MTQLSLWNDVRVPQEYYDHYVRTGECVNCHHKLRHDLHAFNHYKRYHTRQQQVATPPGRRQRYFVWFASKQRWQEVYSPVTLAMYSWVGYCTAYTKERRVAR